MKLNELTLNELCEFYGYEIEEKGNSVEVNVNWLSDTVWGYVKKYNLKDWSKEGVKRFLYNNIGLVRNFFDTMGHIDVIYLPYMWECYFYYKCCNGYGSDYKTLNEIVQLDILNGHRFIDTKLY